MPYFEVVWGGTRRILMDAPFPEGFAQPLQMAYILIGKGWHGGFYPEGMKRASDRCECTTPGRFRGRMSGVNFNVVNRTLVESLEEEQPDLYAAQPSLQQLEQFTVPNGFRRLPLTTASLPLTAAQQGQAQVVSLQQLEQMFTVTQQAVRAELAAPAEGRPPEWVFDNRPRGR